MSENAEKLERINQIMVFKNKRNKIQLKKKQIEFYKYEDSKLPPESFRILERIRSSKRKKNFSMLYKNLLQGSSSDEDDEEEKEEDYDDSDDSDEEFIKKNAKRTDKLGLDAHLQGLQGTAPRSIDWINLARKANAKQTITGLSPGNPITGIDLYRKFMEAEIHKKRTTWTEEDDDKLKLYVKMHGTNHWK
jgi:hypothetical protein